MSTPTCAGNPPVRRMLYVTLRGEFAIYTDPDSKMLRILAPTLPPETVTPHNFYAAGPWASPIDIPAGAKLHLKNAVGDSTRPEDCSEIIMNLGPTNPDPTGARFDITLPLPLAVIPGLTENTNSVFITVTDASGKVTFPKVPENPTIVPILVYAWDPADQDQNKYPYLQSESDPSQIWPSGNDGTDLSPFFRVIHIFGTSNTTTEGKQHAQVAFAAAAKMLGVNAKIDWTPGSPGPVQEVVAPAGLMCPEANSFAYQRKGLAPAELHQGLFASRELNEDGDGNCGPVTGGGGPN